MILILVIFGAILGGILLGGFPDGVIIGALFGVFAGLALKQSERLDAMQNQLTAMRKNLKRFDRTVEPAARETVVKRKAVPRQPEEPRAAAKTIPPVARTVNKKPPEVTPTVTKPTVPPATPIPPKPVVPPAQKVPPSGIESRVPKVEPSPPVTPKSKPTPKPPAAPVWPKPPEPALLGDLAQRWVFGGNPLVKIGVLILFLGLAFALRYAAEHGLLPLWLRYAGVAATGIGLIAFGWRWRHREDNYGLVLQGGGIGVLYLTTLAAMKLHPLLPVGLGFTLLVLIAAFAAFSAVVEDAMLLAVVAALGGFAAPVLASTGAGNHIVLFSYLTVLNLGIVAIAWFKRWRVLNILGYVCSFGLGSTWAAEHYRDELFWSTEPFLLLLFGCYVLITVLFARRTLADAGDSDASTLGEHIRQASKQVKYVDGSLAFGVPFSAFWVQHLLVEPYHYGTAISAMGFALFYFLLAFILIKRTGKRYVLLNETLVALGAVFGTLAIPLLETPWTAAAWAIEAGGVYWIGYRQRQLHVRLFAFLVLIGSAVYFLPELRLSSTGTVLDGPILSAILLTVSTGFTFWLMWRAEPDHLYDFENLLRPIVAVFGAAMLATIPLLLFAREWASPALAILGTALVYLSAALSDRTVLGTGWIYQLVGGVLFLTMLDIGSSGTVFDGPTLSALLLTVNTGFTYWLMWRAEPERPYDFGRDLRPIVVGFGAAILATIPLLLFAGEWASPVLAILGAALIYLSVRLSDRTVLGAGWIYQLAGGVLFLTTLETARSGTVLADGWPGLLGTCLVGTAMLAGAAMVAPNLFTRKPDGDASELAISVNVALLAGLVFINLAPLFVLSWRMSTMIWPLVGIATLVWAVRTRHKGVIVFSLVLQGIAGFFHLRTWVVGDVVPALSDEATAFMNSGFLGPLVIAMAGLVCARLMHRGTRKEEFDIGLGWIAIGWGGLWWAFAWTAEITRVVPDSNVTAALIAVTLATALTCSLVSQRLDWSQLGQAVLVYLPVLVILGGRDVLGNIGHPAAGWGAIAWPAALVVHGLLLRRQKAASLAQLVGHAHTVGVWLFIALASLEVRWWLLQWSVSVTAWPLLGGMLVPAAYVWAVSRQKVLSWWPVREFFVPYVMTAALPLIVYLLGWLWFTNATSTGNAQPLPYLPALNPLELGYMFVIGSVFLWWRLVRMREPLYNLDVLASSVLAGTAFVAVTGGVIRACHHWANIPWARDALFASDTVQASLSIVWGTLAISLMLFGNRRQIRIVWFIGAALVGVVVVKLFLVELSAVGTLQRIVSFIVVGLLLLLVGYVAPLPPKDKAETDAMP
jgi:uncharacterized membrane protein